MFKLVIFCLMSANVLSNPTERPEERSELTTSQPNITLESVVSTIASIIESNHQNLNFDLYPTLHSALMGPFSLISRAFEDVLKFYNQRSFSQIISISGLRSAVIGAPAQLVRYWGSLIDMEMECIYRTICDLSAFTSPRLPYWMSQLVGIYFTTHSTNNKLFKAVANGIINQNCLNYYPKCSPTAFFNRLSSNMNGIISTTISPITLQRVMSAFNTTSNQIQS